MYSEELSNIVKSGIAAAVVGMVYGGLPGARHARERFIQLSQAEIYQNRVDAVVRHKEHICIKCIFFVTKDFHLHGRLLSLSINASVYLSTLFFDAWIALFLYFLQLRKAHYYLMGLKCAYSEVLCMYLCLSSVQLIMQLFVGLCALAGGGAGG